MGNFVGIRTTRSTAGPLAFGADPGDAFFVAILAERGPVNTQVLANSMSKVRRVFGGPTPQPRGVSQTKYSSGYEVLDRFFSKGGRKAVVVRIVGSGATTGTVTVEDRGSTPEDTIKFKGKGPGSWANNYQVRVEDGTQTDTFRLHVLDPNGNVVETWDNLKMLGEDLAEVNDGSDYIQLEDLGSSNASPANRPANDTYTLGDDTPTAATAATQGADDNDPSASTIVGSTTAAGKRTGLKAFRSSKYGRGFIAAPDLDSDTTVVDELEAIGEEYYRIYLSSTDDGADISTAQTERQDHDQYGTAFYFPRPKVKDDHTGGIKTIPPVGHIAADWQKAVQSQGPGKVPAGDDFEINFVRGMETQANGQPYLDGPKGNAETLMSKHINPIYDRNGTGPKVWGGRAATAENAWKYLHAAYLYNVIASRVENALEQLIYDVADEQMFQQVKMGIRGFMIDLHKEGAFNGAIPGERETPDPEIHAFAVKCDESLLSDIDKQNGIVRVDIWFKAALVAETIEVELSKRVAT